MKSHSPYTIALVVFLVSAVSYGGSSMGHQPVTKGGDGNSGCAGCGGGGKGTTPPPSDAAPPP